jgi:glycosyltransferase involved in cell wall biosynthesis
MRVALLSHTARAHDAIGNHVAETAAFFLERGAAVRVFVQSAHRLHPAVRACAQPVDAVEPHGPVWEFLAGADLVIAQFSQACELLHFLPLLAGGKPRLLLDYHGVTPAALWTGPDRAVLERGHQQRGLVWCVDEAIAHSEFIRQDLMTGTDFPGERIHRLPLVVDRAHFHRHESRFPHRRLGLPDARFLLYVGRLAGNKRVPLLVEALPHLPPTLHAVVVGDMSGPYALEAENCRAMARELKVTDRVHLLGELGDNELAEAYRSASALVIPSLHEGFCVPVIEAMASGLPVIASRSAALPETVGDAGLTFTPDDPVDLARQVMRVLAEPAAEARSEAAPRRRIAIVCFRFGAGIVGGAEQSLRTIAESLDFAGQTVEVFTTCNESESDWRNDLQAGTTSCGGLILHRFPIDPHCRDSHLESVRTVIDAQGRVSPQQEVEYLRHSIHSTALVEALRERASEFDAIVVGPYLFGLTCDVVRAFPDRTLLLPCFHDEPIARLGIWPDDYGRAGGILLHSEEEKELALTRLGVNGPTTVVIGTCIDATRAETQPMGERPYVAYCGRYSAQKNLPLLLEWMRRYRQERPEGLDLVLMGRGEVTLPAKPWARDLGWVDEERKRAVVARAQALIQLSQQESLSIVALEAWAQETPVIVHAGCAVLTGQVQRSEGGIAIADYNEFAHALDELAAGSGAWRERGCRGRAYVEQHYASRQQFVTRLLAAIDDLRVPLAERMRRRGLKRSAPCDRPVWREAFGGIVERVLDTGPRAYRPAIVFESLQAVIGVRPGAPTSLVPFRIHNRGTHALAADGPGQTTLWAEVTDLPSGAVIAPRRCTPLSGLLIPGATQTVMLRVGVPSEAGVYALRVWAEHPEGDRRASSESVRVPLHVGNDTSAGCGLSPLLDGIRQLLNQAREGQRLPDDYVDVTEGRFARWKRWAKRTLLNNFKRAYVDVLSRRQSRVNEQLVAAVEQLAECCASLDHAVRALNAQPRTEDRLPDPVLQDRSGP